jgi:nitroreductase
MAEVPAVIVVGGTGAPAPSAPRIAVATWYGSLFPAVQNLLLAARSHGLGATLTTFLLPLEAQLRELLLIPEDVSLVACIPMGYPAGRFGRPARQPVEEVAHLNQFGTPLPNPRW